MGPHTGPDAPLAPPLAQERALPTPAAGEETIAALAEDDEPGDIREAARRGLPLEGEDAQALEGALRRRAGGFLEVEVDNIKLPDERATVRVDLSDAETIRRAALAEGARAEVERLEEQAKETAAQYKSRIAGQRAIMAEHSKAAGLRYVEERPLCPALLVRDPDHKHGWTVAVHHPATGAELFRRDASPGELSAAREPALPMRTQRMVEEALEDEDR